MSLSQYIKTLVSACPPKQSRTIKQGNPSSPMGGLIAMALLLCTACLTQRDDTPRRPNVLFILADDLGYSDLSCMGSKYYETPHIDAIAQGGTIFTDGYSASQVCSPARASIMTGQYTTRHGITDWIGAATGPAWQEKKKRHSKLIPPEYAHHIPSTITSLPEAFKETGYRTFFAGKWHLGGEGHLPTDHGYDINIGGYHVGSPPGGFFAPFNNPYLDDHEKGENLSIRLAKETSKFIEASSEEPFFAFLSFYAVHAPLQTTQKKWSKYRDKAAKLNLPQEGFEDGHFLPIRKYQDNPVYAGMIETMDEAVGIVLETLERLDIDEHTIIVFTSDNGGVVSGDHYSTTCSPLKGGKGYEWEGGIRVPYILYVPHIESQASTSTSPVISTDLYPTLLDLTGIAHRPDDHIDGISISDALYGEALPDRPLIWHYPHYGNQGGRPVSIIRHGEWKLIHFWEEDSHELYHLRTDIHEDHDLSMTEINKATDMSAMLMKHLQMTGAKKPMPDPKYDPIQEAKIIAKMKLSAKEKYETLRMDMMQKDWSPNNTWWGSNPDTDH